MTFNKQAPVKNTGAFFYGQRPRERSGVAALNGAVCQRGVAEAAQRKGLSADTIAYFWEKTTGSCSPGSFGGTRPPDGFVGYAF